MSEGEIQIIENKIQRISVEERAPDIHGTMRTTHRNAVIEIKDGVFQDCKFNSLKTPYTLADWKFVKIVADLVCRCDK